jgi:hypothetical protein
VHLGTRSVSLSLCGGNESVAIGERLRSRVTDGSSLGRFLRADSSANGEGDGGGHDRAADGYVVTAGAGRRRPL